jgi:hypothetical protein
VLAYAVRKRGEASPGSDPDSPEKPFFRAYGATITEPHLLRFEQLVVTETVPAGEEPVVFFAGDHIPTRHLLVRWPGLHIGRYETNALRIIGEHHDQS